MVSLRIIRDIFAAFVIKILLLQTFQGCAVLGQQDSNQRRNQAYYGPNICGGRAVSNSQSCCQGWSAVPSNGGYRCSVPSCRSSCGTGTCIRPDLCYCPGGVVQTQPCGAASEEKNCDNLCHNGGTCRLGRPGSTLCECKEGYTGAQCEEAVCGSGCLNGGRCIGPDRCACTYGFTGKRCEVDFRTGPCYTQVEGDTCKGQLIGVTCTRGLCCATIGQAWGQPCQQCPRAPEPCRRGFIFHDSNKQCVDINECIAIPGLCVGGRCTNTLGSYRCECLPGQRKNPTTGACDGKELPGGETCADAGADACKNGRCLNDDKGYYCVCNAGFLASDDKKKCINNRKATCFRTTGCRDPIGIPLTQVDCCCTYSMSGWGESRICESCPTKNTPAYYRVCPGSDPLTGGENFTRPDNGDDTGHCSLYPNLCPNGRCKSTPGSYRCICDKGFRLNRQGQCVDIDECREYGYCRENGRCYNNPGSYSCDCNSGFALSTDKRYCTDKNECQESDKCPNGNCINLDGSYKCRCNPGFRSSVDMEVCLDIDECSEISGVCRNGICLNALGTYTCRCNAGYELSPDRTFCVDKNECTETGMCENGRCINEDGAYKCLCNVGFKSTPDEKSCVDVDECVTNDNKLCPNGNCINTPGSFRCECFAGFTLSASGRSCKDTRKGYCFMDIDNAGQCKNPSRLLITRSTCCCSLEMSSAKGLGWGDPQCKLCPSQGSDDYDKLCTYGDGMDGNGDDINECLIYPTICKNGVCENLQGSYRCKCDEGYTYEPATKRCVDVDECLLNRNLCQFGTCRNVPGSFKCACPTGFTFNDETKSCEDVDECAENDRLCQGGNCLNNEGSYRCDCSVPGTTFDPVRKICVDSRKAACWGKFSGRCEEKVGDRMTKEDCCATLGKAWGSPCEECPAASDCPKGFKHDGSSCVDINECVMMEGMCEGGRCVNTQGSFRCDCPTGFRVGADGKTCVDFRVSNCYSNYVRGQCANDFGGRYMKQVCCCSVGQAWGEPCEPCPSTGSDEYKKLCNGGSGKGPDQPVDNGMTDRLTDINECVYFPSLCENGRCKNTLGSFECLCNQGYAIDEAGKSCLDIDECRISFGVCGNGTCRNTPGRFRCECQTGFESTMMMQTCMDINECARDRTLCRGGTCVNTIGSFSCICPDGHEMTQDGRGCKDIDECSIESGICSNGRCENYMGGYQCFCDNGYKPSPPRTSCVDIDECASYNGRCDNLCQNTPGSYLCTCQQGFRMGQDGKSCTDINECVEVGDICNTGDCVNLQGSYRCVCKAGMSITQDGKGCTDLDECSGPDKMCKNGLCKNTMGSYICDCDRGYAVQPAKGIGCLDDDECSNSKAACDKNADCRNTEGSYKCQCKDGFRGDGFLCIDVNECINANGQCDDQAKCTNTPGSFRCVCDDGFVGDGFDCLDVDECSVNPNLCDNGQCLNYPGSYRCECDMGFAPKDDEKTCVDIDECSTFENLCVNGRCENVFGMFRCICNRGYELDSTGGNCTDVDECKNPDNCQYGECVNRQGTYICQCPPNYELTPAGTGCVDPRQGYCYSDYPFGGVQGVCSRDLAPNVGQDVCCCTIGLSWGETNGFCELCPRNGTAEYDYLCPGGPGFQPNTLTIILEDIDECAEFPNLCAGGTCRNSFGSFTCICPPGYSLDTATYACEDIDECLVNPDICGAGGTCINNRGSYSCVCPDNTKLMPGGDSCMDMRKGACYSQVAELTSPSRRNKCDGLLSTDTTKMVCCCSLGKAWGSACELCPLSGTADYEKQCGGVSPGTIIDPNSGKPADLDECSKIPELCENGVCVNTLGSFRCQCPKGMELNAEGTVCEDIDECQSGQNPCVGDATCENTKGSYRCSCPIGFQVSSNQRSCIDIDECSDDRFCQNGECLNLIGSYRCVCKKGFRSSLNQDACLDINECLVQPGLCRNGSCVNTEGSFRCNCYTGYQTSQNGDCIDVDECRTTPGGLCNLGRCKNTPGSYVCECQGGFRLSLDRRQCEDVDECVERRDVCDNARCQNFPGGFRCICDPGYQLSDDETTCVDVNECDDIHMCHGGRCINSPGSFQCFCDVGFVLSTDKKMCLDTRQGTCFMTFKKGQCTEERAIKSNKAECCCSRGAAWSWNEGACEICPEPNEGSFAVLCPDGFGFIMGEGMMDDLDECALYPTICNNGYCINTDGSYRCECGPGYTLLPSGNRCIDDDECARRNPCGNGTCTNTPGSFECKCSDGFLPGRNRVCEDVNECDESAIQCAFRCKNIPGAYRCVCPPGYKVAPDGLHCQDVDECAIGANDCKYACKNLVGMHMCICPEGYEKIGQGDNCRDIDECAADRNICGNGRCRNTEGTYRCDCFAGYEVSNDGKVCIDNRQGFCYMTSYGGRCVSRGDNLELKTKAMCCCSMGQAWGPGCEQCPRRGTAVYKTLCMHGPGFTPDGQDIDECALDSTACRNGRCLNTMGSYRCICDAGYQPDRDGTACIDVDECTASINTCEKTCQNTQGSFVCRCPQGYALNTDGRTCRDIDECQFKTHNCPQECINTPGSFKCSCQEGFIVGELNGRCADKDECAEDPNLCQPSGTCQNTPGGFKCTCKRGFVPDETGTRCVDNNECSGQQRCEYGCQNLHGGFKCQCPPGFIQHLYWNQCLDQNECSTPNICGGGTCINTIGSYRCFCNNGANFNPLSQSCGPSGVGQYGQQQLGGGGGRDSCLQNQCNFGCAGQGQGQGGGFGCGCPNGYQPVGQGHCVTTINPRVTGQIQPNTNFDRNQQYPHVANQGSTGLTEGEGCYGCKNGNGQNGNGQQGSAGQEFGGTGNGNYGNGNFNPNGNSNYDYYPTRRLRSKRDTREWNKDEVEDFLEGFKKRPEDDNNNTETPTKPRHHHRHRHHKKQKTGDENNQGQKTQQSNATGPVTLVLYEQDLKKDMSLMRLTPAIKMLKYKLKYAIVAKNEGGIFKLKADEHDVFSVVLKEAIKRGFYQVDILGRPIKHKDRHLPDTHLDVELDLYVI
ncbi:fibrillin-2-like isoform X2 [Lineus longissimus]|uniref:fibrillin-2-like isoform X2 n=1 Tax=Lineus longissimus TaxID=88925 RepID=UPI002B4D5F86